MSLNFDTSKLDPAFTTRKGSSNPGTMEDPTKDYWSHELEAIVWAHLAVGLSGVTDANIGTWYKRYVMWSLACGTPSNKLYITLEMLRKAVGLTCNVSNETDAAFAKKIRTRMEEYASDAYYRAARELDTPAEDFGEL